MVSVSRRAGPPHLGQAPFEGLADVVSGEPPAGDVHVLRQQDGQVSSVSGTMPHLSQYTMGMGVPQ